LYEVKVKSSIIMTTTTTAPTATTKFTDELRLLAGDQWERIIHHRFTKELAAGTIDKQGVLKHYLIQDHRFLDSFVILLASIIANLPTLKDRIPGCQFLAVITGPENTYFERSFEALGITSQERNDTPDADATKEFCKLMRDVAKSNRLEEMLAVIVVCEWSYLSWGQNVLRAAEEGGAKVCRDNFVTYEWVDLHSGPAFEGVISYLRELLDREGERLKLLPDDENSKKRLAACERRFLEAVQIEEDFFDYAYAEE